MVDAISDRDLFEIGKAAAKHRLITGGSGIALGLPANFAALGLLSGRSAALPGIAGPGCVLSGSCSKASQLQVMKYLDTHPGLLLDASELVSGEVNPSTAANWAMDRINAEPIIYSTTSPEKVASAQVKFGRESLARIIESFFGELAVRLADGGVRRIVIGGGETSGAVVSALGLDRLQVGSEIDPGVPALGSNRDGPLGLALKSGNFGGPDFFERALRNLEAAA